MKQSLLGFVLVLVLVVFAGMGIAHVFKPSPPLQTREPMK